MISYEKGRSPPCLAQAATDDVWDPAPPWLDKQEIRQALVRDQAGVCAYCQRHIEAEFRHGGGDGALLGVDNGNQSTKIEHWQPRATGGEHFVWRNLLGVCVGRVADAEARPRPVVVRTCDTAKGNATLFLHPVRGRGGDPRQHLSYHRDGTIVAKDERAAEDLQILNLNAPYLRRERRRVYQQLMTHTKRLGRPGFSRQRILKEIRRLDSGAQLAHRELVRYVWLRWSRNFGAT